MQFTHRRQFAVQSAARQLHVMQIHPLFLSEEPSTPRIRYIFASLRGFADLDPLILQRPCMLHVPSLVCSFTVFHNYVGWLIVITIVCGSEFFFGVLSFSLLFSFVRVL